jgi:hypothetical protein
MKKIYLILILFLSLQVNAQFFEGFEGAVFPPDGWFVTDNGVGTDVSWRFNVLPFPPYEGTRCAYVDREWIGIDNTSEDWLITPAITVSTNASLNFTSRQTLMGDVGTLYQVRISTSSQTDQSSFTMLAPYTEQTINSGIDYETKSISLSAYAGQTVYIAFVRIFTQLANQTSGDRWLLDNVMVGAVNTVSGNISYSADGSCDSSAVPWPSGTVAIAVDSNIYNVFNNPSNGNYSYSTLANSVTVTPNISISNYFTISPNVQTVNFTSAGSTETANFCIAPNGIHNDLEVGLIPITPAIPGFNTKYIIVYKNKGTTTQSGTVTFNFNDYYSDFVIAISDPNNMQPDLLTWNFTNLAPFETRQIEIVLNLNSPVETPAVNIGDLLILGAQVSSSVTDETYLDNIANLTQVVVGSFDPNDKQVSDLSYYFENADSVDLYYTIRFQNLGTFAAQNVVVSDVLSDKLDAGKLQMVSSSHPYMSKYNALTRKLEFIFEGINLPAAIDNEPGSKGYVSFKIKPISTITLGQTIENKADIYFDFNAPVTTNTTSTNIETLLKTNNYNPNVFKVYPNPVKNNLNISIDSGISIQSIIIHNPLGQLVKTLVTDEIDASLTIDVTDLKSGTYFIEINSNQGKTTKKFVKL